VFNWLLRDSMPALGAALLAAPALASNRSQRLLNTL